MSELSMFRICLLLIIILTMQNAGGAQSTVLVVGDSLSAGFGLNSGESWVSLLQRRLDSEGYGYHVVNASISGDTSRGGKSRLPRAVKVHKPAVVIIELGGNDGLRGIPISEMQKNLDSMIRTGQEAGAAVILVPMRIPSNYGPAYTEKFEQVYKDLIQRYNLPSTRFILDDVATNPDLMQSDGIHPNAEAQSTMLTNIWPALEQTLKQEK